MNKFNEQGQKHGPWEEEWYWFNGKLKYKGNYLNGQKHGLWEEYWSNGGLEEIRYYIR